MNLSYPLLLDGGLSNVLEAKGCDLNNQLWTASLITANPESIVESHLDYLEAGAQCITTSGYQASIAGLLKLEHDLPTAERLIARPVELAREAIDRFISQADLAQRPLIAASIGPYGAYLGDGSEYRGKYDVSVEQLREFHRRRIELLDDSAADLLAIETIPSFTEAKVVADLLAGCQKPAWVSLSCQDAEHLNDDTLLMEAARHFAACDQVFAIGVNCTAPNYISSLINILQQSAPSKRIVIYPNSGEVYDPETKTWAGISDPQAFASHAIRWVAEGADIIGGCCRIGPKHIRQIAQALNK